MGLGTRLAGVSIALHAGVGALHVTVYVAPVKMPRFATTEYGGGGGEPGQSRGNGGGETIEIEVPVIVMLVGEPIV